MRTDAIYRLIDLKDEELSGLRLDLERLDQLLKDAQDNFQSALSDQEEFMGKIREVESRDRLFSANNMIEHRLFLTHLDARRKQAGQMLEEITTQHDLARQALEQVYIEKKSFELIAERKHHIWQQKQNRKQFQMDDDNELLRSQRIVE